MNTNEMIAALDEEISRLRQIRELLGDATQTPKRRGRPKGSGKKAVSFDPAEFASPKRTISPEGRERIASAQRARWAKQNKTAGRLGRPAGAKTSSVSLAATKGSGAVKAKRGRPAGKATAPSKRPVGRPSGVKSAVKRGPGRPAGSKNAAKRSPAPAAAGAETTSTE